MFGIHLCLQMAIGTGEHRVVVRIRVAGSTDAVGIAMRHGEPSVVKGGSGPINDGREMTGETSLGETRCDVIRIGGGVVFGSMAGVAIGGCSGEFPAHMARHALRSGMFADQCKADRAVVEGSTQPVVRRMARRAILRVAKGFVIGVGGGVVFI